MSFSSTASVCFLNTFLSGEKYRGSQGVNTTVVVENLTVTLYPWDEVSNSDGEVVSLGRSVHWMCQNLKYICSLFLFF